MPDFSFLAQPYQPPPVAQTLGQLYAIKSEGQNQQMRSIQLQQAQQGMADDQAERQALSTNTTTGPDGTPRVNRAATLGALYKSAPTRALALQGQFTAADVAQAKAQQDWQKQQLANAKAHVDLVGQLTSGITDQRSYEAALAKGVQLGVVKPDEFPALYDPQIVAHAQQQALTVKDQIDQHLKQMGVDETVTHDRATETTAAAHAANEAATLAETTRNHRVEANQRGQQIGIEAGRLDIERQKNNFDQNGQVEAQAQQVAAGDLKAPSMSRNNPFNRAVMARVLEINPRYSDALYTTKQNFKTKGDATSLQGLAVTLGHLDNLAETSKSLGYAPLLGTAMQSGEDSAFSAANIGAAGEIGKLITGGHITQGEYQEFQKAMGSSRQGIRDAAIGKFRELIADRVGGIMQKYKSGTGTDLPLDQYFDAPTQQRLKSIHGVTHGVAAATPPAGSTHIAPGSDKRNYYVDATGKVLGVAP